MVGMGFPWPGRGEKPITYILAEQKSKTFIWLVENLWIRFYDEKYKSKIY